MEYAIRAQTNEVYFGVECRESAQVLIAMVRPPLLVFGLPYNMWCVSCLHRPVALSVKLGVLVVVANMNPALILCVFKYLVTTLIIAFLLQYKNWWAYYLDTFQGHSSICISLDTRHDSERSDDCIDFTMIPIGKTAEHIKSYKVSIDQKYCANGNRGTRKRIGRITDFAYATKYVYVSRSAAYRSPLLSSQRLSSVTTRRPGLSDAVYFYVYQIVKQYVDYIFNTKIDLIRHHKFFGGNCVTQNMFTM
ncbi:hypothetical protein AGLY_012047 [Aphis glycines]|uniref:Uncharacterized protein n=1 Tax=Aphis glycines TaxID=307491 RepID=A0A6G0TAC6_APHGL|nr:hypothetical protein AGLY_012047 [Aphis glycines]